MKYNRKTIEVITLIFSTIIFIITILGINQIAIIQTKSEKTVENRIIN